MVERALVDVFIERPLAKKFRDRVNRRSDGHRAEARSVSEELCRRWFETEAEKNRSVGIEHRLVRPDHRFDVHRRPADGDGLDLRGRGVGSSERSVRGDPRQTALMTDPCRLARKIKDQRLRIGDGEIAQVATDNRRSIATVRRERILTKHPQIARLHVDGNGRHSLRREQHAQRLVGIRETQLPDILCTGKPDRATGIVEREVLHSLQATSQRDDLDQRSGGIMLLQRRLAEHPQAAILGDGKVLRRDRDAGREHAVGVEMQNAILECGPGACVIRIEHEQPRRTDAIVEIAQRALHLNDARRIQPGQPRLGERPHGAIGPVDRDRHRRLERNIQNDTVRGRIDLMQSVVVAEPESRSGDCEWTEGRDDREGAVGSRSDLCICSGVPFLYMCG
ncbi:MAG TPA: hypothetical protein VGK04_04850 [Thermoanaerobaculia bacterium]